MEDLFKLFDKVKARYDGEREGHGHGCTGDKVCDMCVRCGVSDVVCKHPSISDGVCDTCCQVLWYGMENDEEFYSRTIRRGDNTHNRLAHFYNF